MVNLFQIEVELKLMNWKIIGFYLTFSLFREAISSLFCCLNSFLALLLTLQTIWVANICGTL